MVEIGYTLREHGAKNFLPLKASLKLSEKQGQGATQILNLTEEAFLSRRGLLGPLTSAAVKSRLPGLRACPLVRS